MMRTMLSIIAAIVFFSSPALASDLWRVAHQPPEVTNPKLGVELVIPASGLKRARVLVVQQEGYRLVEMKRASDTFRADVSFDQLATLKYQFQAESNQGQFFESDYFSVRQPSSTRLEGRVLELAAKHQANVAKSEQLQKVLEGIEHTDPKLLAKRRNEELGRALVLLGQKERQLAALKGEQKP